MKRVKTMEDKIKIIYSQTKGVEFGAKVNTIQIDRINFIEHLSFSAFHEGNRLPQCVWLNINSCLEGKSHCWQQMHFMQPMPIASSVVRER